MRQDSTRGHHILAYNEHDWVHSLICLFACLFINSTASTNINGMHASIYPEDCLCVCTSFVCCICVCVWVCVFSESSTVEWNATKWILKKQQPAVHYKIILEWLCVAELGIGNRELCLYWIKISVCQYVCKYVCAFVSASVYIWIDIFRVCVYMCVNVCVL